MGDGFDFRLAWETTGNDNAQITTEVGSATASGYISIMEGADKGNANRSPSGTSADPVLRVYSSDETQANDYIDQQRWHDAEMLLNKSLEKLPDSEKLQTVYREFIKQRAYYLKSLYYQLYINKAEWLVKNQDVNNELARTMPKDRDTRKAMEQYQEEIQHVYLYRFLGRKWHHHVNQLQDFLDMVL